MRTRNVIFTLGSTRPVQKGSYPCAGLLRPGIGTERCVTDPG